jgi:hypothetical protein
MDEFQKSLNEILSLMGKIAVVAAILPILFGIINFRLLNKALKVLFWFCVIRLSVIVAIQIIVWAVNNYTDFFRPILTKLDIGSMDFMSVFAHLNNLIMLGIYFSIVIFDEKTRWGIKVLSIGLSLSVIINYLFIEGYKTQSLYNSTISNIFCFVLPCIHLWFIYGQSTKVPLYKNAYFWISLGILLPNLLGLIASFFGKKLDETDLTLFFMLDIGYCVLQIIGYLIIAFGFYFARYTRYLPALNNPVKTPSVAKS